MTTYRKKYRLSCGGVSKDFNQQPTMQEVEAFDAFIPAKITEEIKLEVFHIEVEDLEVSRPQSNPIRNNS